MTEKRRRDIHILVVDDHEDSRETALDYLKALGYENVTVCENGKEALDKLEEDSSIEMILSDWDMPSVDGLTLLKKIRATEKWANIPFIIMSSPRSTEYEKISLAVSDMVDDYIIKPYRLETLADKLDKALSSSIHGPQKTVVIADDDVDSRETVRDYLKSFGFKKIEAFEDGEAALNYLKAHYTEVGMIISDWEMPKLKGNELLEICRKIKNLADIPFFIITSQQSVERMKVAQAAQMRVDSYLLKPFSRDDLQARLEETMQKKRVQIEVDEAVSEGLEALERGRTKVAYTAFQKALKLNPDYDQGLSGMGDAISKVQNMDAAIPYYQKALAVNPTRESHYIKLAAAYQQKQEYGKAINILNSALHNVQDAVEVSNVHTELALLYVKKDMYRKAFEELQDAMKLDQHNSRASKIFLEVRRHLDKEKKPEKKVKS